MRKIKYETENGLGLTKCEFKQNKSGLLIMVGSLCCCICEYCKKLDSENHVVHCKYPEEKKPCEK